MPIQNILEFRKPLDFSDKAAVIGRANLEASLRPKQSFCVFASTVDKKTGKILYAIANQHEAQDLNARGKPVIYQTI